MATATSTYGLAKLDLVGNRILWADSDTQHNQILLEGWRFREVIPMVTLAISCLCLLCFFAILIALCAVCCGRRDTSKFLPWHSVWVPVFCMIGFFLSDITNRVFHELQRTEPSEYIGVNVVIGSLASIADGLLMVYFLNKSPVDVMHAGWVAVIAMVLAIVVYWIIGTASKGTQIWNLVVQNSAPDPSGDDGSGTSSIITKSLAIFQDLDTVASGMQLLFAIGFALLARRYLNHLSQVEKLRKRLTFAVSVLALAFLARNAVKFAFTLVYSQLGNKIPPLAIQLVFMAFYGPLSVAIWACIISIAHMRGKESSRCGSTAFTTTTTTPVYHKVAQMSVTEAENREYPYQQQQYHAKPGVMVDVYPAPQGYESYRHQGINQKY